MTSEPGIERGGAPDEVAIEDCLPDPVEVSAVPSGCLVLELTLAAERADLDDGRRPDPHDEVDGVFDMSLAEARG